MSGILDILSQQLGGDAIRQMSRQLGADEGATQSAIAGALPVLIGALSKNAAKPGGADALSSALERDHDGSVLDHLGAVLGGSGGGGLSQRSLNGTGILGHILGGERSDVEASLGRAAGLDAGSAGKLLAMLAPLVMGALGRTQRQQGLDSGGLADLLNGERRRARAAAPSGLGGLVGSFLDQDGDGDYKDDVAKMGMGMLGKLFKG